jgi:DNA mismatch repair protein MutL
MTSAETGRRQPWIRPLPERLINKIAAGEVVERPASVVKELAENALDAGADRIEIHIEKSGVRLIRIVDNGCGIGGDQIEVAFGRHATSKISEFADLDRITSYGFRGEALPSIASVSRLRMVSRSREADHAFEIVYEGGVLQSKQAVAGPPGTSVEVRELFFNTPARRKFLKAETTEARHISRVVMALAMGRHDVGFTYVLNERKVFLRPPGETLRDRVTGLLAPGRTLIEVRGESESMRLEAYIGSPDLVQSNRNGQYLFINGRYIQSATLAHALAAGYGDLLPRGNFPIGAVLLTIDPAEIDVNVHPAKTEVRLSRERDIYSLIQRSVHEALRQSGTIPLFRMPGGIDRSDALTNTRSEGLPNKIPGIAQSAAGGASFVSQMYRSISPDPSTPLPDVVTVNTATGEIVESRPADSQPLGVPETMPEAFRLVGRFGDLYLLFQSGDDLYIVDQHTAHERVLYEDMLKRLDAQGAVGQHLLLPVQVDLNAEQMSVFDEAQEILNRSGFSAELFGDTTIRIEAVPAILSRKSPEKMIRSILDDIASLRKTGHDLRKAAAQSIACRSAVMAGDRLSDQEALALVSRLVECEAMYSCPHGRPTFIKIHRQDLDRQFGRG